MVIREAIRDWVQHRYDDLGPGYRGEIPDVGSIHIAPSEYDNMGSLEWLGIVKKSFDEHVFRAFHRMKKASAQLSEYGHAARVGVVWMPAWEAPAPQVAQHLSARWRVGKYRVPAHLDIAVIFASQNRHGPSVPQAEPIALTPRGHEVIRMRWRAGLTNWRFAEW